MDYLHPISHSSWIQTLLASALGAAASLPQLLTGPLPHASTIVPPHTAPATPCHAFPSPELPTQPSPLPHAQLSPLPCVLPSLSPPTPFTTFPRATSGPRAACPNHLPCFIEGGGEMAVRSKMPKSNLLPTKTLYR